MLLMRNWNFLFVLLHQFVKLQLIYAQKFVNHNAYGYGPYGAYGGMHTNARHGLPLGYEYGTSRQAAQYAYYGPIYRKARIGKLKYRFKIREDRMNYFECRRRSRTKNKSRPYNKIFYDTFCHYHLGDYPPGRRRLAHKGRDLLSGGLGDVKYLDVNTESRNTRANKVDRSRFYYGDADTPVSTHPDAALGGVTLIDGPIGSLAGPRTIYGGHSLYWLPGLPDDSIDGAHGENHPDDKNADHINYHSDVCLLRLDFFCLGGGSVHLDYYNRKNPDAR